MPDARAAAGDDAIVLEIVRNYLMRTCEEMKAVVVRAAYSTVIHEVLDYCCGIYLPDGGAVAEQSGIPIFLGNVGSVIQASNAAIGLDGLEPGDVIIANDPYSGGSHMCDTTTLLPIFDRGEAFGFVGFRAHLLDYGGKAPGGLFSDTTELFQEGLVIPPVKLYRAGEPNPDVFRLLEANTRFPRENTGDMRALVSASRVGHERVQELIARYGPNRLRSMFDELMGRGEQASRAAVEQIPDGTYSASCMHDGTGSDDAPLDGPYRIALTITVEGSDMKVDLTGTSDQLTGPANCPLGASISGIRAAFKYIVAPEYPTNEGCFRPLQVHVPEGTLLNPRKPAPTSMYFTPVSSVIELFQRALAPAIPDRTIAGTFGDICVTVYFGKHPDTQQPFLCSEPEGGGYGASPQGDGESCLVAPLNGDTKNVPIEVAEVKYGVLCERYELVPDSGGAGKFRGGLGSVREFSVRADARVGVSFLFDRQLEPAWGLEGGRSGGLNQAWFDRGTPDERWIGKITDHTLEGGATFAGIAGGGGGWGNPFERDPELVQRDVRDGFVTFDAAARDYGVALDRDTLEIRVEATDVLRRDGEST